MRNASVELAQEGPPIFGIVFPGVLSVQDYGYQRIVSMQHPLPAGVPDLIEKVLRGVRRRHAAVNKANEIAEAAVPEDHLDLTVFLP